MARLLVPAVIALAWSFVEARASSSVASAAAELASEPAPDLIPERSWKAATERAAAEKKPILLCILNDAEPACQRMFDKVYCDAEVMKKLEGFVLIISSPATHTLVEAVRDGERTPCCAKYKPLLCSEHQAIEKEIKPQFADATGTVIVPQHAIFGIDGKLLVKRPYAMKSSGFIGFLNGGLAMVGADGADASGAGAASSARSPAVELMMKKILAAEDDTERTNASKELLSDATPDRQAAFLELLGRMKKPEDKGVLIRAAGRLELQGWASTIAALLDEKERLVRNCAVVTLEEEHAVAAVEDLLGLWPNEKDPEIRKDLLRALGPCAVGNDVAKKILLDELNSTNEKHRVAAALSLGWFLKDAKAVAAALEARFKKEKSKPVQYALIWGIGDSGDPAQGAFIEGLVTGSKDDDLWKVAAVTKQRLIKGTLEESARTALGRGGFKELRRLLGVIYDDDKIVRNFVRDADLRAGGKR